MSVVRANVGSILEFKDDLVGFADGNSDESGLIVSTAIVGRHQLIAIHVKDGDHLFRSALSQPRHNRGAIGHYHEARRGGILLAALGESSDPGSVQRLQLVKGSVRRDRGFM